jgi:hypothetical protein
MEPFDSVETYQSIRYSFNLAGIIPIAGYQNEYGTIWPDFLNPLGQNYYAIHKCVMECAFAGCDTIWIVCNNDYAPLIKSFIGESVTDPRSYERWYYTRSGKKIYKLKTIPVMYISMPLKFLHRCTIPLSILYGAYAVKRVTNKISKWANPDRYFVSFLNNHYNFNALIDLRQQIKNFNPFFVSHDNKTIVDGVASAFTFDNKDLDAMLKWSKLKNNHSLQDVFSNINTENNYTWQPKFSIDTKTWDGYRQYLGSDFTKDFKAFNSIFKEFILKPIYKERKNGNVR